MTRDSIIDEVRTLRDEIAKEYDYDIDAIFIALRQMEATGRGHHVALAPRNIPDLDQTDLSGVVAPPGVAASVSLRRR